MRGKLWFTAGLFGSGIVCNNISKWSFKSEYHDKNEDKSHVEKCNNCTFYGLYDGHGGDKISGYLKENVHKYFTKIFHDEKEIKGKFDQIQNELLKKDSWEAFTSGSTCLVVLEDDEHIQTINAGDSRAILVKEDGCIIQLTNDHTCNNPDEYARINAIDDYKQLKIYDDGDSKRIGLLEPTRGFGDTDTYPYIVCTPEINLYKKTPNDDFLVMGTDGLWDVMDNEEVADFVRNNDRDESAAKKLCTNAQDNGSDDDITVIIKFNK